MQSVLDNINMKRKRLLSTVVIYYKHMDAVWENRTKPEFPPILLLKHIMEEQGTVYSIHMSIVAQEKIQCNAGFVTVMEGCGIQPHWCCPRPV